MNGIQRVKCLILLMLAFGLFQGSLFAEIMLGEVTAVNQQEQTVTINQLDQTGVGVTRKNLRLNLRDDTQFSGLQSIQDLKVGDEVLVEANKRIFGPWEIKHLQSTKPSSSVQAAIQAGKSAIGMTKQETKQQVSAASPKEIEQIEKSKPAETQAGAPRS